MGNRPKPVQPLKRVLQRPAKINKVHTLYKTKEFAVMEFKAYIFCQFCYLLKPVSVQTVDTCSQHLRVSEQFAFRESGLNVKDAIR